MPIGMYFALSAVLFSIGLAGVLVRRNVIVLFMCVELMLNAVNLTLAGAARMWGGPDGHVFVFFVIVVAAAEVVVGLAMVVNIFFRRGTLDVDAPTLLRR
ncbi:MAG: NADH-quinone oxidoreductase subunit NuoK [Nitriliruptorales bacterium]|nr:NADH-quinone oxidoreductase subunit NuoK [Nitriliruptorales bacterium]